MPRLPLRIENPGAPDAFIIDRKRREQPQPGRRPHAPSPHIEDWRRYPEDQTPGDLEQPKTPEGGVVIVDHTVWQMKKAIQQVGIA